MLGKKLIKLLLKLKYSTTVDGYHAETKEGQSGPLESEASYFYSVNSFY